jgi:restriction system protein
MARSFYSLALEAARAAERAAKAEARAAEKIRREQARTAARVDRENKEAYAARRQIECKLLNDELEEQIADLESLLTTSLSRSLPFEWRQLFQRLSESSLDDDPNLRLSPPPILNVPPPPAGLARLVPGSAKRYATERVRAQSRFEKAQQEYLEVVKSRQEAYELLCRNADAKNHEMSIFKERYRAGDPEAVAAFAHLVLDGSELPQGFHNEYQIAFLPESRQLVAEYRAPTLEEVVPVVERYKYVKARDAIDGLPRAERQRRALYADLVAQLALRIVSELLRCDREEIIQVVALNAFVDTIDRSTGKRMRVYLVSLRATREQFNEVDLRHVDPVACLKRLSAEVSRSPAELLPVKPLVVFDMQDPRFIEESDVLSTLDHRSNLMELTPGEFENLITNLFQKMGLETRLTQASRDGGVDCVAFDPRPILGGKVVIQAKRYKNTVGVSAVRDLFGTMHNEGASKGILVTTSGYGTAAFDFANGKPIELISGSNLLYLLKEHAGMDAKIEMPDDWIDPR